MSPAWVICEWLTQQFDIICFPQSNTCHLCSQKLSPVGERILCQRCVDALLLANIAPADRVLRLHAPISLCVAAYWYQDEARRLVHNLKYNSNCASALPLAMAMCAALSELPNSLRPTVDFVLPVPLHKKRERKRGYNQALVLASAVCAQTGFSLLPNALSRIKATTSQVYCDVIIRQASMRGAFEVTNPKMVVNKHLLLIDDVLTTGSTAVACAETLLAAGAAEVSLLTACRS